MITKALVRKGNVGEKEGYCFEVYFNNRPYPSIISALFKTKLGTQRKLDRYIRTRHLDTYGNAE